VPTLFKLAGIPLRDDFDGEPIPVTEEMLSTNEKSEHVNIEFWGDYLVEGNTFFGASYFPNNTFKHIRVIGDGYDIAYAVWCTNEHELYDMTVGFPPLPVHLGNGKNSRLTLAERPLPNHQSLQQSCCCGGVDC
jgi:hypothetical protein